MALPSRSGNALTTDYRFADRLPVLGSGFCPVSTADGSRFGYLALYWRLYATAGPWFCRLTAYLPPHAFHATRQHAALYHHGWFFPDVVLAVTDATVTAEQRPAHRRLYSHTRY